MSKHPKAAVSGGEIAFDWRIGSPPAKVWASVSDAKEASQWLAPNIVLESHVGGRVVIDWGDDSKAEGQITRFEPGSVLEYTWKNEEFPEGSLVRWEVAPDGDGTRLKLTHSDLKGSDKSIRALAAGWHDFLDALLAHLGEQEHPNRHEELLKEYGAS
jgi:uncharacterized protein YndB with AHSA1/START domain